MQADTILRDDTTATHREDQIQATSQFKPFARNCLIDERYTLS